MATTARPFRVGVDGRAFSSVAGGVRRYTVELYAAMRRVDPSIDIVAIGAPDEATLPDGIVRHPAMALPTNLGWMAVAIPLAVRSAKLDVYHAPAYTAPLWGVHPQAVTIHDVSPVRVPEWDAYKNGPLRRLFYRRSALAADRVITDSGFSRDEIHAAYGIALTSIDVVPLAASGTFTPGPCEPSRLPPGVRQPYALHVGDVQVRRNLSTALAAVLAVRRASSRTLGLVCAGVDRGIGAALREQAAAANDPDAVVLPGSVSEEALLNLYRGASMLLYPSRYEGFGLPILEAMRCGVPVVGARCASTPELVGDAGILVEALDVDAWGTAIACLLHEPDRRSSLVDGGFLRSAEYSWTRTATETLAILRRVARGQA